MSTVVRSFAVAWTPSTIRPPLSDVRPGVDQDRSRSPVISGTEVVGQVASRFAIAVTFPTVDLYGNSDMEIQQTRIPFHFPGIRNPVRQGTAVAGVSRARPE
jgi:hypothetical protein